MLLLQRKLRRIYLKKKKKRREEKHTQRLYLSITVPIDPVDPLAHNLSAKRKINRFNFIYLKLSNLTEDLILVRYH